MSYIVLARKYRPQTFDDVIGQGHITDILKKAIETNRAAHAYLFSGPRGIGKTSCARILAKSLNCQKGPTLTPCGNCPACREIAQSTSFDVLEIDAASNRGIDEIRTLRENVKFAPSYGRYKIYIVDEVHMLTMEAFNALLKTLEEPPDHVKFILATTSSEKIPKTIISRCQRFDFKRISLQLIVETLEKICIKEDLTINQEALYAIAKAAEGSFRDSLSILDQISALSERSIVSNDIFNMLGLVETQLIFELIDSVGESNAVLSLQILEKIINQGKDIKQLTKDLIEHFRHLMVIKIGGKALGSLIDYPIAIKESFLKQAERFTLPKILNAMELLIKAQETARITETLRLPLEMALAKMTCAIDLKEAKNISSPHPTQVPILPSRPISLPTPQPAVLPVKENPIYNPIPPKSTDAPLSTTRLLDFEKIKKSWDALTLAVSKERMSVATFLQEGYPFSFKDTQLTISLPPQCAFQKESLESKENLKLVEKIFSEKLEAPIFIRYQLAQNFQSREEDTIVQAALETFKGKVVNRWHNE